jgi:hypothetical protein
MWVHISYTADKWDLADRYRTRLAGRTAESQKLEGKIKKQEAAKPLMLFNAKLQDLW